MALRIPEGLRKKRDREARRVSQRKTKVKKTLREKGFGGDAGDLTTNQWKIILAAFDGCCAYCGEMFKKLTMDHIIPASKGGRHTAMNVVPCCMFCNQSKKDNLVVPKYYPSDWAKIVEVLT